MLSVDHASDQGDGTGAQREHIRPLLRPDDPQDAMTAYYALSYDARRVQLTLHRSSDNKVDGFAAVCQTGRDLFVPLVVSRGPENAMHDLMGGALRVGRAYTIITKETARQVIEQVVAPEWSRVNLVYVFDPPSYRPVLNVMVQPGDDPFRFEIRVQDRAVSVAGVNWHSSRLAEMYVYTEPDSQGRGWGRAVGARCVQALLEAHLLPLYIVSENNLPSRHLADQLGFRDSGAREFECQGQLRT
jgi:GNAT superfamily N-acetyltransferase